jgi:hypothetical protein
MALDDREQARRMRDRPTGERSMWGSVAEAAGLFGDREDQFVVLAGVLITTAVLYDVYRRYTRPGPGE